MSCSIVLVSNVCWVLCTRLVSLIHVCYVNLSMQTYKVTSTYLIAFRNWCSWQIVTQDKETAKLYQIQESLTPYYYYCKNISRT
jgi:hypothetical protein